MFKRVGLEIELNIDGPDGNAFVLLGLAKRFAEQLGKDPKAIIEEMSGGDYKNLLRVFDREFGAFVTLTTDNTEYLKAFNRDEQQFLSEDNSPIRD